MSHHVTITITDTEELALKDVTASIDEWAENALKNRARKAQEQILNRLYNHCTENNIPIASADEENGISAAEAQLQQAFDELVATTPEQRAAAAQEQSANLYGAT